MKADVVVVKVEPGEVVEAGQVLNLLLSMYLFFVCLFVCCLLVFLVVEAGQVILRYESSTLLLIRCCESVR